MQYAINFINYRSLKLSLPARCTQSTELKIPGNYSGQFLAGGFESAETGLKRCALKGGDK